MAALTDVSDTVRQLSRDYGTFFEVNFAPTVTATVRLPHPIVEPTSISVIDNATGDPVPGTDYAIQGHGGIMKFKTPATYTEGVTITGIYHQWFLDSDLEFYAQFIVQEHLWHRPGTTLSSIFGAEVQVMGIGAFIGALWGLLSEVATDIDVVTPEGANLPVHQRFGQVQQLIQFWTIRYDEKAAMLNVGLKRIEMFDLRRRSRLTDRYVPLYRPREIDNPRPPVRIRPPIDPGVSTGFEQEEEFWNSTHGEEVGAEGGSLGFGGWDTIGTGGT